MTKTLRTLALALALCGAVMTVPVTTTGCKTHQTAVFNTLSALETSVNAAFKSYLDLVVAGKVPTTSVKNVSLDYDLFQASMTAATLAAKGNTNAVAPQATVDAGAKVLNSILAAKGGK